MADDTGISSLREHFSLIVVGLWSSVIGLGYFVGRRTVRAHDAHDERLSNHAKRLARLEDHVELLEGAEGKILRELDAIKKQNQASMTDREWIRRTLVKISADVEERKG